MELPWCHRPSYLLRAILPPVRLTAVKTDSAHGPAAGRRSLPNYGAGQWRRPQGLLRNDRLTQGRVSSSEDISEQRRGRESELAAIVVQTVKGCAGMQCGAAKRPQTSQQTQKFSVHKL